MEEVKKKGNPFPVSRKGKPNKATKELKDAILKSFEMVGGEKYLAEQAILNPGPFMALIGKVLPKDVSLTANVTNTIEYKPATEYIDHMIDRLNAITPSEQILISSTTSRHQEH